MRTADAHLLWREYRLLEGVIPHFPALGALAASVEARIWVCDVGVGPAY